MDKRSRLIIKQPFQIGDLVKVKGIVKFIYIDKDEDIPPNATILYKPQTSYPRKIKTLIRYPIIETLAIVIGWSVKRTGIYDPGHSSYSSIYGYIDADPPRLDSITMDYHKVWLVEALNTNHRYFEPLLCSEDDLELVGRYE